MLSRVDSNRAKGFVRLPGSADGRTHGSRACRACGCKFSPWLPAGEITPLIRLENSEALRPGSEVAIFGSGFRSVPGVEAAVDLTEPTRLVATVPELTPDNYTVQWTSLSVDGDMLSGSYAFGVQPPTERPVSIVALLSAGLIGLALLAAIVARHRRGSRVTTPGL